MLKVCYNDPNHKFKTTKKGNPNLCRHPKIEGVWLCRPCSSNLLNKGRKHSKPVWNKGKGKHRYCIDCGNEISTYSSCLRCRSCSKKGKFNGMLGKTIVPWSKGLTKYTDPRLASIGKQASQRLTNKPKSKEHILKLALSGKGKHECSEEFRNAARERRLLQVMPFHDSKPEIIIQTKLRELQIEFDTHIPIFGQPDIFIQPNICIFIDGDFWHGNPKFYNANDILFADVTVRDRRNKDQDVTETLEEMGMKVIRIWESDVYNNLENCIAIIRCEK